MAVGIACWFPATLPTENPYAHHMNERRWKRLLRDVQEQRCILMLGPRLEGLQRRRQGRLLMGKAVTEAFVFGLG